MMFMSILLLFSGCYDSQEIDDYAYITLMGIDKGISDRIRLTFQVPEFSEATGEGGGGGGAGLKNEAEKTEKENFTIDSSSILSAIATMNANIPKILNFMHLKAIVISEELAESGDLGELVAPLIRYRQLRNIINVIVCKGKAEDFVKSAKPYLGGLVTETLEELIERSSYTGFYNDMSIGLLSDEIKSPYTQLLTIYGAINKGENLTADGPMYEGEYKIPGDFYAGDVPRKGGQEIELLGTAVFDGDKMVGKLTGFESQMLHLVWGDLRRSVFTIPDPGDPKEAIPLEIKEFEPPRIKVDTKTDKPHIDVKLKMEGDITSVPSRIHYEYYKNKQIIEEVFEKYLEDGIQKTFQKGKALNVDIFHFGTRAVKNFWTIPEWENYKWLEKISQATLSVDVEFTVRRTGKLHESQPIVSSEGKE